MSASAAWAYTATATRWPLLARDGWRGRESFGAPVSFLCDYKAEERSVRDAKGAEKVSRLALYTERSDIQPGDRVLIGASTEADPTAAGAVEVLSVERFADTFDRLADDYVVRT